MSMTLKKVKEILKAEVLSGADSLDMKIEMACGCDLMSDVLAFAKAGALILTGLTNLHVVRTAETLDIKAICFVRGKTPDRETIELAKSKSIPLLSVGLPMFEACGVLYRAGLPGCSETDG